MRFAEGADRARGSRWAEALERASPGARESVERTLKQWNNIVREYLRSETGLRLSVGDEAQSVPVKVVDGMPKAFECSIQQFEDLEWLLLNRPALEAAISGTRFMEASAARLPSTWLEEAGLADKRAICAVRQTAEAWLKKLDEL